MTMSQLPSSAIGADASTADCKALLDQIAKAAHPGGSPKGAWKRLSKRGSGARVERVFQNGSGLCALVSQTPGKLSVERLADDVESLGAQSAKATRPASVEARATAAAAAQARRALGVAGSSGAEEGEENEDEDEEGCDKALYYPLMKKAGAEPLGSPLRVAIGNLFEFDIPSSDPDMENMFSIMGASAGTPSPDQPHKLEELFGYDVIESPNESCDHWIHLPPAEAIALLLDNGFKPSAKSMKLSDPQHHPEYVAVLRARVERVELDEAIPSARSAGRKPL
jgi:hypothetical protein